VAKPAVKAIDRAVKFSKPEPRRKRYKRTSQGRKHFPLNKHARLAFGKHLYRGQG
jgi:hypothetical protein